MGNDNAPTKTGQARLKYWAIPLILILVSKFTRADMPDWRAWTSTKPGWGPQKRLIYD